MKASKYFFNPGLVLFLLFSLGCTKTDQAARGNHTPEETTMKEITITGMAFNAKWGAIVETEDDGVWYIGGLDSWEDPYYGKKVTVKGSPLSIEHKEEDLYNENGEIRQGMVGEQKILTKAHWELSE